MAIIELDSVTRRYDHIVALEDISLRFQKGELAFVTGSSGAGKSTLLRLLYAADRPTSGTVRIGGTDVGRLRASAIPYLRRNVGVVFQDFKLLPHRTVTENVAVALEVMGVGRRDITRRVERVLGEVNLSHRAYSLPAQLSGGEQQRVAIARALVSEPAILLADEPTGNLDRELGLQTMELLQRANVRGITVLIATHDDALMARWPRRVVGLDRGRVVSDVTPIRALAAA